MLYSNSTVFSTLNEGIDCKQFVQQSISYNQVNKRTSSLELCVTVYLLNFIIQARYLMLGLKSLAFSRRKQGISVKIQRKGLRKDISFMQNRHYL